MTGKWKPPRLAQTSSHHISFSSHASLSKLIRNHANLLRITYPNFVTRSYLRSNNVSLSSWWNAKPCWTCWCNGVPLNRLCVERGSSCHVERGNDIEERWRDSVCTPQHLSFIFWLLHNTYLLCIVKLSQLLHQPSCGRQSWFIFGFEHSSTEKYGKTRLKAGVFFGTWHRTRFSLCVRRGVLRASVTLRRVDPPTQSAQMLSRGKQEVEFSQWALSKA